MGPSVSVWSTFRDNRDRRTMCRTTRSARAPPARTRCTREGNSAAARWRTAIPLVAPCAALEMRWSNTGIAKGVMLELVHGSRSAAARDGVCKLETERRH